jgi:two-component system phosphate regulon sensor histidine kinase PhoR
VSEAKRFAPDAVTEVVHDLRAPLAVASGYLSMLRDGTFGAAPERWEAPLDVLTAKLEETRLLVDDVLALRRLDQDVAAPSDQVVDLNEVARTAAERAQPRAQLLSGSVVVEGDCARSVLARGDEHQTLRILDNLINNALLYSGEERRVVLRVEDDAGPQLAVEDSGPGIPRNVREHLFEPYTRARGSTVAGHGLGLFISRKLARQMRGELALDERRGRSGGRFVLRLRAPNDGLPASAASA